MTEKVRTFIPILLAILCFSDPEKESNLKFPLISFFMHFLNFTKQKAFIYVLVCSGTNQDKSSMGFKIQNSLYTIRMLGGIQLMFFSVQQFDLISMKSAHM